MAPFPGRSSRVRHFNIIVQRNRLVECLWYIPAMADKTSVVGRSAAPGAASDTTLETSRLLVEFLHAAYATRRLDTDVEGNGDGATKGDAGHHGTESADMSSPRGQGRDPYLPARRANGGAAGHRPGISYGWASRVVEELEKAGYAIRERDADDRRVVRVRLNPDKSGEVERAYQWRGPRSRPRSSPWAPPNAQPVRIFLRRLNSLLREEEPASIDSPSGAPKPVTIPLVGSPRTPREARGSGSRPAGRRHLRLAGPMSWAPPAVVASRLLTGLGDGHVPTKGSCPSRQS